MRILSYADLGPKKGIRWSRQHIHKLVKQGRFPKPIQMGEQTTGFIEDEIDALIASRIRERDEAGAA
jgi:prophage regulatory protein